MGPLGPSILDPIYVIYAFGSMLSCILQWETKIFRKSQMKKRFGARNQFRAAHLWPFGLLDHSLNAMSQIEALWCPNQ